MTNADDGHAQAHYPHRASAGAVPEASVFFIGDVALDEYFNASRWPGLADKAYVEPKTSYVGGMIANAACVYAGLGGRPEFISLLGETQLARDLCQALEVRGVSTRHMLHEPGLPDPRNLIVLVGGDHVVLTVDVGRPPMRLGEQAIAAIMRPGFLYTTLNRARRLHAASLQGHALFDAFRRCGRQTIFDLDVEGFQPDDIGLLRGAAALILNRAGFERSFGTVSPGAVFRWMAEHEVGLVVRTLADEGAEIYDGHRVLTRPALPVPVVDVTGAGDAFGGALVFGLAQKWDIENAFDLAIIAASRAVTVEGPQGGVASLATLRDFAASYGWGPPGPWERMSDV
jgi:sugar/nucleoside kinase (ribokinase family)